MPGKDLCDMSGATGRTREEFTVYNVMLPRKYYPQWQGNLFEQRCKAGPASLFQDLNEDAQACEQYHSMTLCNCQRIHKVWDPHSYRERCARKGQDCLESARLHAHSFSTGLLQWTS